MKIYLVPKRLNVCAKRMFSYMAFAKAYITWWNGLSFLIYEDVYLPLQWVNKVVGFQMQQ